MSRPTISLCVICGNEEAVIIRFLDSFKDAFDELCIVRAIGNQLHDKTLTLAKEWCERHAKQFRCAEYFNGGVDSLEIVGAAVDDNKPGTWPHVDDFAAARNMSWALATCDWQMWADCDDLLQPAIPGKDDEGGAALIRLCAGAGSHDYFFFTYDIRSQNERNVRERLFRRGISSWAQPVHERVIAPPVDRATTKALIENRVVFEHAPQVGRNRDPMRNRRIMAYHTRYIHLFAFELHREWFFDWEFYRRPEDAERATKWAEIANQTDCLPEQRYDILLNQAKIAAVKDVEHAIDLVWSAIRIHPRDRHAWGRLAEYELEANRGERAAVVTGFMQSIPKSQENGYPSNNRFHGWEGAQLRIRSLRAAGQEDMARKGEDSVFKANRSRISLLHATRGRPDLALLTRNTFFRAAFIPLGVEHILAIDSDDKESLEKLKHYRHVVVDPPRGCVAAWNAAAEASSGNVLVQLSDDWNPCQDWDIAIWEALRSVTSERLRITPMDEKDRGEIEDAAVGTCPLVLAIHDGHRKDALLCMAILTRARYEQQFDSTEHAHDAGDSWITKTEPYVFHPDYFGVFSDTEFTVRAYDDGVVVQAQHIVFEHRHPLWQGIPFEQWHETTRRQNAPERYAEGLAIFNRRNPRHEIGVKS